MLNWLSYVTAINYKEFSTHMAGDEDFELSLESTHDLFNYKTPNNNTY